MMQDACATALEMTKSWGGGLVSDWGDQGVSQSACKLGNILGSGCGL